MKIIVITIFAIMIALITNAKNNDVIFILDSSAAFNQGHIAVLIGNEETGWQYVSINGTGATSKPWGKNINADTGTFITDEKGVEIKGLKRAIKRACEINPKEKHKYHKFIRLKTTQDEDSIALHEAKKTAFVWFYGIIGPGKSCLDVAQNTYSAIIRKRKLDNKGSIVGKNDLRPKKWFQKIEERIKMANSYAKENKNKISVIKDNDK